MDKKLYDLWKREQYPFNQIIYTIDDLVRINDLYYYLINIIQFLKNKFPNEKLFLNHDWHEHDGYINESQEIEWNNLDGILESTESLYNTRDEDYEVRITIYPQSLKFILRYYVLDDDDDPESYPGIWGSIDLTIDNNYKDEFDDIIIRKKIDCLTTTYPKHYFDQSHGG